MITGGNAFHHQSKNGYGDKIKLILTRVGLETELPFIYMGKQIISEYVSISKSRDKSLPVLAVRLGLFTLRNDPTTHASENTFSFNSVKKDTLVFQNVDIFCSMF